MDTKSRDPIPGLPGSLPKLENATRDLFRLSGGQSIPVEARLSAEPSVPPAGKGAAKAPSIPAEAPSSASGRKQEASIIFSLEALMKSAAPAPDKSQKDDEIDQQLWDMHAVTPIFGTAQDQALLTTPLEPPPRSSAVDSMTVSSHQPGGRRWPLLLALGAGLVVALGGFGFWSLRSSASASSIADRASETERVGTADTVASTPANPGSNAGVHAGTLPPVVAQATAAGNQPAGNIPAGNQAAATAAPAAAGPGAATAPVAPPAAGAGEAAAAQGATASVKSGDSASNSGEEAAPAKEKEPKAHATLSRSTRVKAPAKLEPFDKSAAVTALNAAAAKAESCPHAGGGKGKVQLTFGTNGKVSSAEIVEGPFAAGTPAGKCALRHFHAAKVPPFSGSAVTVAKSFKLP